MNELASLQETMHHLMAFTGVNTYIPISIYAPVNLIYRQCMNIPKGILVPILDEFYCYCLTTSFFTFTWDSPLSSFSLSPDSTRRAGKRLWPNINKNSHPFLVRDDVYFGFLEKYKRTEKLG